MLSGGIIWELAKHQVGKIQRRFSIKNLQKSSPWLTFHPPIGWLKAAQPSNMLLNCLPLLTSQSVMFSLKVGISAKRDEKTLIWETFQSFILSLRNENTCISLWLKCNTHGTRSDLPIHTRVMTSTPARAEIFFDQVIECTSVRHR